MSESEKFEFDGTTATLDNEDKKQGKKTDSPATLLDRLRDVIEQEVKRPEIVIPIPDREGVSVVFSPNVEEPELKRWRKQAGEGRKDGMDFMKQSFSTEKRSQTTRATPLPLLLEKSWTW